MTFVRDIDFKSRSFGIKFTIASAFYNLILDPDLFSFVRYPFTIPWSKICCCCCCCCCYI